ncbi:MAG: 6-bladed beta-propeller [Tannerella sp.]|nr:6-bladed beta-propeller [Tannerella sp.]
MNTIIKIIFFSFLTLFGSCSHHSETEKHQSKRNNVLNVRDRLKEIEMEDVLIGSIVRMCIIDDYLIIADHKSFDKLIHLFDKNDYSCLISIGERGQGPDDITLMGHIEPDETNRVFYVNDHGKNVIFGYALDSVLTNPLYKREVKMKMNTEQFPDKYCYLNDTMSIGITIIPTSYSTFNQSVARWNMETEEIIPMVYTNPKVHNKRIQIAASLKDGAYVECYTNYDLMTICTLDGKLKYNIYGPNWSEENGNTQHFGKVTFCDKKIIAAYSGGNRLTDEYYPTKLLVFNMNGDYLITLDFGHMITDYCYDTEKNRIILNLNAEIQFAYLDLDGIII